MLGFISLIVVLVLWSRVTRLSAEVALLKQQAQSSTSNASIKQPQPPVLNNQVPSGNQSQVIEETYYQPVADQVAAQGLDFDVFAWFRRNWLLKTGVILILMGFGWFISYAFIHDWIGPFGRVALGVITGLLLMFLGTWRMAKDATQGKMFLVLGSALVLMTTFAARLVYGFFSPELALVFSFVVALYVAATALHFNMKNIAIYGLVIAFVAPFLTVAPVDTKMLFSYLVAISFASIWLAWAKGWRNINAVAILGFSMYVLPYAFKVYKLSEVNEFFVLSASYLMAFTYLIVSVAGAIKSTDPDDSSDTVVAMFDAALVLGVTFAFVPSEFQSWLLIAWIIVYAAAGYLSFSQTKNTSMFYVYAMITVLFIAVVTALEFDGKALLYAYAIESAIVSVSGYLATRKLDVGYGLSLLMIGPVLMSTPSFVSSMWKSGVRHEDFMVLVTMGLLLCMLGVFYYFSEQEKEQYADKSVGEGYVHLITIGSLYFLALVWLCSGAVFVTPGTAVMVSLVTYTIVGIVCYFYGLVENGKSLKMYGAALLSFVVLRLLFVDVWDMALASRVVTFISIGLLFISTAFLGKKAKEEAGQ